MNAVSNDDRGAKSSDRDREPLTGTVERVTFHNADTGFCVLRIVVRGRRELVTLVGHAPSISAGETVQASGRWENTVQHGMQFRAEHLQTIPPSSKEGIERYLGSGLIRGLGKELARRLVAAFGERVFEVIEQHPERLRTVEGIGPVRLRRILEGWEEQKAVREIMVFLQSHGVGTSRAVRIYRNYGADAVPLIIEDPYRLARDIRGVGFLSADRVAERLGVARDAPIRARAGLSYTLLEALSKGHCSLSYRGLLDEAERLLTIDVAILERALEDELSAGTLIDDSIEGERCVFLAYLWAAERTIGARLRTLLEGVPSWGVIDPQLAIPWVEERLGVVLAASQRRAVELALASKVAVITGGPGVGKTTLVNAILRIVRAKGVSVALCAPTGRAAKRLSESTGLEAKTIHRLLEFDPQHGGFRRDPHNPVDCQLLVADEMSMVDTLLMAALVSALGDGSALLLVGDVDQLPSVGPGQVLRDIIDSGSVPVARLTEIFRQAAESRIVVNAHRINQGILPELDGDGDVAGSDFFFVDASDPEDAQRKILEIVARRIPRRFGLDAKRDVQVLCPMNRGALGARSLNLELQRELNPAHGPSVERFGFTYRAGDKVMQTENDYDRDVFNGDLGTVGTIDEEDQELTVLFGEGREQRTVTYRYGELDQLQLAYAITIHKAQGSEYPAVVVPLAMQHYVMLQRNLIYTAVTRGRKLVVLVGDRRALATAVRGRPLAPRLSKLKEWLA